MIIQLIGVEVLYFRDLKTLKHYDECYSEKSSVS